jgi:hypothetical protein
MFSSRRIALSFTLAACLLRFDCAAAAPTLSYKVAARYPSGNSRAIREVTSLRTTYYSCKGGDIKGGDTKAVADCGAPPAQTRR